VVPQPLELAKMFNYYLKSRPRSFQRGTYEAHSYDALHLSPRTVAQKRHFAVFADKIDFVIHKNLL